MEKMKKFITIFVLLALMWLPLPAKAASGSIDIDESQIGKGIISVVYEGKAPAVVRISKGNVQHAYQVVAGQNYPLEDGNGVYTVLVGELVNGNRYKVVAQKQITLDLPDPNLVYLQSTVLVNWNREMNAVITAGELVKDADNEQGKMAVIYEYVVSHITYDYDEAQWVKAQYIPKVDEVFRKATGICYDYAVLTAVMLRSAGIPTKVVTGYHKDAPATYHAWNQVYLQAPGKWVTLDTTYDAIRRQAGKETPMIKAEQDYIAE